jgi:cytochrome P450
MAVMLHSIPMMLVSLATVLLILVPGVIIINLTLRLFSSASLPASLPWVGEGTRTGVLARARANLLSFFNLRDLLDEGYNKYSKIDQAYVLPYYLNGPQVILPLSQVRWLLDQPDAVLSQEHVNRQFLQSEHTFMLANLVKDPVHPEIIQHQLTKRLNTFAADIVDETQMCLEENWGLDVQEWREVNVYDTMLDIVARLSTRVFMGLPLCRDREFIEACQSFNRKVALSAAAISIFPAWLKPFVAPMFTCYDYIQYKRCSNFIMPIIKERLAHAALGDREKLPLSDDKPPNDYVQWAIEHALAKPTVNPMELDPGVIACRFSVLCFAAIQSSVITLTNTLFDLAASPDCKESLSMMHDEVAKESDNSPWTKATLARMPHVDSALRESLRLNGFIERGIMKMVVAREGVTLSDGSHIPYGTKVGVSGYSVHHDEGAYADAMAYHPFRFVGDGEGQRRPLALVTTSEKFLGFSHGSHSCPGRFFAANQLKIALAHIALHYEIEPIDERPVNKWLFGHIAPPLVEKLRVRRRKQ